MYKKKLRSFIETLLTLKTPIGHENSMVTVDINKNNINSFVPDMFQVIDMRDDTLLVMQFRGNEKENTHTITMERRMKRTDIDAIVSLCPDSIVNIELIHGVETVMKY